MAGHAADGRRGSRWSLLVWGCAGLVMLAPLVAMQVTDEMAWTAFDFAFLAGLLAALCLGFELAVRRTGDAGYRGAAAVALAAAFLLVLINGAVGVIGSERENANLLYGAVLAVALIGSLVARFRPRGMAWAMVAAAVAQALVPTIAAGQGAGMLVWTPQVLGLTGGLVAMWLVSAGLFRRAAGRVPAI